MADINKDSTYFLIQDSEGTYRLPLRALGDLVIMNDEENSIVEDLIIEINELSAMILEISADFSKEHYSLEELKTKYELIDEVNNLIDDPEILTEEDVDKYVIDSRIAQIASVDYLYDNEQKDADNVFTKLENEINGYKVNIYS